MSGKPPSLETIIYIVIIAGFFCIAYGFYLYGSHRYKSIHEGFKLRQNKKEPDEKIKEKLSKLSPSDVKDTINANAEETGEIKSKKDKISRLLDEAYEELNANKHKEDYEELIDELEELVDTNILNHIMENKDNLLSADLSNPTTMAEIQRINDLDKFKDVLKNMTSIVKSN